MGVDSDAARWAFVEITGRADAAAGARKTEDGN